MRLNLLPPERKTLLAEEHQFHVVRRLLLSWLLGIVLLSGGILMLNRTLEQKFASLQDAMTRLQAQSAGTGSANIRATIRDINDRVQLLSAGLRTERTWSPLLAALAGLVPADVQLTQLSFEQNGAVRLMGVAKNRDAFLQFKQRLESSPNVKDVRSPITNILTKENVQFELTASLAAAEETP